MPRIFISYRREDSEAHAGRIYDRLWSHFGRDNVFMDVDNIPLGVDFRKNLDKAVSQCDVLLAVIGERWLEARHQQGPKQGQRRLDDPNDFVRIEIQSAMARGIPVIPVLVGTARMPREGDLPANLKDLAYRNAAEVRSGRDFHDDVERLIRGIEPQTAGTALALPQPPLQASRGKGSRRWWFVMGVIVFLLGVLAGLWATGVMRLKPPDDTPFPGGDEQPIAGVYNNPRPALLDCTGPNGVSAVEMHKAQEAWARYLGFTVEELVEIDKDVKMVFVLVPPGKFRMGTPNEEQAYITKTYFNGMRPKWLDDETLHTVTLTEPFYLGKCEVTQTQYEALTGQNPSEFKGPDLPVENVSWELAYRYGQQLTDVRREIFVYRLPTEAEWEYACRAGRPASMPFGVGDGKSLSSREANIDGEHPYGGAYKDLYLEKTCAVGTYKPNALGLYDMHGNTYEWCADRYGPYPEGQVTNPSGPSEGSVRICRGGSWAIAGWGCRAAFRSYEVPVKRHGNLGFRLARSIPPAGK